MTSNSARQTRAHVTEQRVVEEAMLMIREEPTAAFTMSRLASRLGVATPSLYSHVPGKQYVIERIRSIVVAEIDFSGFQSLQWDEALMRWGESYADAFVQYPETIPLLTTNPVQASELITQYNAATQSLLNAGWPESLIFTVITTIESFVLGSVLDLVAPVEMVTPKQEESYPLLVSLLQEHSPGSDRAKSTFTFGLASLIEGLKGQLERVTSQ